MRIQPTTESITRPRRTARFGALGEVCRAGLATRGNTRLEPEAVIEAVRRGINYLNWCGHADGLSAAVRRLGERRREVLVAVQLEARAADAAHRELRGYLGELGTTYLDAVTYYYVEHENEWREIIGPGGAAEALEDLRREGTVRAIGLTTHQRPLAAALAASGRLDLLMVRYNAAHRSAEDDVFPATEARGLPVVTYTGLRWGALLQPTPDDPPGFTPPAAPEWYRFVLCHPSVTVGILAPDGERELAEDLTLLDDWRGLEVERYEALRAHGDRVRRHAGAFP
jgi:predicted aldo/keto reductase-like oxidoreductase